MNEPSTHMFWNKLSTRRCKLATLRFRRKLATLRFRSKLTTLRIGRRQSTRKF